MEASRLFFFRRALAVAPVIVPVTGLTNYTPVAVDKALLSANGATCFKLINPGPCWVWLRGVAGDGSTVVKEMGHYIGPGMTDICTSQMPDFVGAVADVEPGFPAPNSGGVLTTPFRVILIYGSGNA